MQVRPARPGDAETLRAAVSNVREATVFDETNDPLLQVSAAAVREAANSAACCFVAEADGELIGLAVAHPDADGHEAELLTLWTRPDRMGDGVTDRLLSQVAESLVREGTETIRTSVGSDGAAIVEYYQSHGFSKCEVARGRSGENMVFSAPLDRFL